jgi:hypothetical protein
LVHEVRVGLSLYAWVAVAICLAFLFMIARFYEIKSGERSYYQVVSVPAVLFVTGAVWYALSTQDFVGQMVPDLMYATGGAVLIVWGAYLIRLMTGGRQ